MKCLVRSLIIASAGLLLPMTAMPASAADTYSGASTGEPGRCAPFNFEVAVAEGKISGNATTLSDRGRTNAWSLSGTVAANGAVAMTAERKGAVDQGLSKTAWGGQVRGSTMTLTQRGSVLCAAPRTASLQRR